MNASKHTLRINGRIYTYTDARLQRNECGRTVHPRTNSK